MSSKKDFTSENPALSFISGSKPKEENKKQEIKIDNSSIEEEGIRYKLDPRYIETKSKQINSLIQPSTYKALKEYAKENHTSMNEIVNQALKNYLYK